MSNEGTPIEGEHTPEEQEALDAGWNPDREKVEKAGKDFVSAKEYLGKGSLFKKIKDQRQRIDQLETTMGQVTAHNQKVAAKDRDKLVKEYESTITRLEAEKLRAMDDGEHQKVVEIDRELRETPPPKVDDHFTEVLGKFQTENDWYGRNSEMSEYADTMGLGYNNKHPEATPEQIFEYVSAETRLRFPKHFENPERSKPTTVESDTLNAPAGKSFGVKDMTADERQVHANFKREGLFKTDSDEQTYFDQVAELRG